jgi:Mannosyltransferase putative
MSREDPAEILADRLAVEVGLDRARARDVAFYFIQRLSEDLHNARTDNADDLVPTEENARRLLDNFVDGLDPSPPASLNGRGIVTCAGGYRYLKGAWVSVGLLRRLGCKLPIQLWHLNPDECRPEISRSLARFDVETIDASSVDCDPVFRPRAGWPLKPFAIAHSLFEEVLFLDADNVCIADPEYLFRSSPYVATGAAFWPDQQRIGPDRAIWRITGVPYQDEPEFESGQILLNKARSWLPLQVTLYMNRHSSFYYRYIHGDKDTFHLAWRKLNADYSIVGVPSQRVEGVIYQHDFEGRRLFQHRNAAKWDQPTHLDGFVYERECFDLCREFDSLWNALD